MCLDGINLKVENLRYIIQVLRKHKSIQRISLSSCNLSDESAELLSILMKSNPNIKAINLSGNKFTSNGLNEIMEGIKSGCNKQLEELDFSYNPIGDLGILTLCRIIENSILPNVKRIYLKEVSN